MQNHLQLLSQLVWELRFLSMASQVAHWRVFGPSSYGDHLLFGQVYEKLNELLDPLAERLTAFSQFEDEVYVSPLAQAQYVYDRTRALYPELQKSLMDAEETSLFFYQHLLSLTKQMRAFGSLLREGDFLTYGLEDMLASTSNELETLVFFLERRSQHSV